MGSVGCLFFFPSLSSSPVQTGVGCWRIAVWQQREQQAGSITEVQLAW